MVGMAQFTPFFLAVLIAWAFSVCLHEFAHAVMAYWGSYRGVRDRGFPRFDPLSYIHPVSSILIPIVFLMLGGVPLPGGAVLIDRSALRGRIWDSLVSAAGPAANFLLFLLLAALLHPAAGLVDPTDPEPSNWARLAGALCVLQLLSVFFNLIPVPPLDGFGIVRPFLSHSIREGADRLGWGGLVLLYFVFSSSGGVGHWLVELVDEVLRAMGIPFEVTWRHYNTALFGSSE